MSGEQNGSVYALDGLRWIEVRRIGADEKVNSEEIIIDIELSLGEILI